MSSDQISDLEAIVEETYGRPDGLDPGTFWSSGFYDYEVLSVLEDVDYSEYDRGCVGRGDMLQLRCLQLEGVWYQPASWCNTWTRIR